MEQFYADEVADVIGLHDAIPLNGDSLERVDTGCIRAAGGRRCRVGKCRGVADQPVRQLRPVAGLVVTSGGGDDRLTIRRIVASLLT